MAVMKYKGQTYGGSSTDVSENDIVYDSADELNPEFESEMLLLENQETTKTFAQKVSTAVKNIRYLLKMLGNTDISAIGDGTVTGTIKVLSDNKANKSEMTAVKGNAEAAYRKGNVNLTPANIGALSADGKAASATVADRLTDFRTAIPEATASASGLMSAGDKSNLGNAVLTQKVAASVVNGTNNPTRVYNVENESVGIDEGKYFTVLNVGSYGSGNFRSQMAFPYQDSNSDSNVYVRTAKGAAWRAWRKLIHSGNIGSQTVAKATNADNATEANSVKSRGTVTQESGTSYPAVRGMSMSQVYNNGFPTSYGNLLTLYGSGVGQLLMSWPGSSGAVSPLYYRSKRDTTDAAYSAWKQIAFTDNIPSVGNGTVTIKQAGASKGTFTMNQSGNTTIELTDNNTTYGVATQSANGLMSATDKTKLDGVRTAWTKMAEGIINPNSISSISRPFPNPYTNYKEIMVIISDNTTSSTYLRKAATYVAPMGINISFQDPNTGASVSCGADSNAGPVDLTGGSKSAKYTVYAK